MGVEEVLAAHLWHHTRETHCACGFRTPLAQLAVEGYIEHVAAMLAPLIAERERVAKVEALREAATNLGRGPTMRWLYERESCDWWGDRPVADWLRDTAASIERTADHE